MLKKLQNLLFEDEEEFEEDEEEFEPEEVTAPQPVFVQTPAPAPTPAPVMPEPPVFEEPEVPAPAPVQPKPAMQRIDVTQPLPVVDNTYTAPRTPKTAARESVFTEEPVKTQKPASLGITADAPAKPVRKPAPAPAPAPKAAAKPAAKPEKPAKAAKSAYNFQPVISPIFGVDEKDMNSLKTTTNRINEKEKASKMVGNISPIISPMYGSNTEESIIAPKDVKKKVVEAAEETVLDDIPDFSLDDILASGDEKFAEEKRVVEETLPLFPDLEFEDDVVPAKKKGK